MSAKVTGIKPGECGRNIRAADSAMQTTICFTILAVLAISAAEEAKPDVKAVEGASNKPKRGIFGLGYGFGYGDYDYPYGGYGDAYGHHHYGLDHHFNFGLPLLHENVKTITVTKKVPYAVPQPYAVEVIKKVPVPVKVAVPVPVDRPYPVHVPKPYPVYVEKKVPYPVEKPVPYPVHVPVAKPVPVPVEKPVYFPDHHHHHHGYGLAGY